MNPPKKNNEQYFGFEQGPIRPPSEAYSLLIRVTRNCPWNRCTFCPLYKKSVFSIRPITHVIKDVDTINHYTNLILNGQTTSLKKDGFEDDQLAFLSAKRWITHGMESIFLQDSNSLAYNPDDLIDLLKHIRTRFPNVKRITSYSRSSTINKISVDVLKDIRSAGLSRIHIGLESGSNEVLKRVCKGATKQIHISAGIKVKDAGIELSEYVMPGLGGQQLSAVHAVETADAINQINPDFIRLRPLALPPQIANNPPFSSKEFMKCSDKQIVDELYLFISGLKKISSTLLSDHILNLFSDLQGTFPQDKNKMLQLLERFQNLPVKQQQLYQLGRRIGLFSSLHDLNNKKLSAQVKLYVYQMKSINKTLDQITDELMQQYI